MLRTQSVGITQETLAQLLVREQDKLKAYTWAIVRDYHLVGDVLQEMALVATRKIEQIRDEQHFPAWARVTCRHLALKVLEQRQPALLVLSNEVLDRLEDQWHRHDTTDSFHLTATLRDCLEELRPRARHIIDLRYGAGLSSSGVAKKLDMKVTTLYVTLARIHRRLGDCIRGKYAQLEVSE